MAGEITSKYVIDVTVDKLAQVQNLHTALQGIVELAANKSTTLTLNLDTREFDRKLNERIRKTGGGRGAATATSGTTAGPTRAGESAGRSRTDSVKVDFGKIEPLLRGMQTTLTGILTATNNVVAAVQAQQRGGRAAPGGLNVADFNKSIALFGSVAGRLEAVANRLASLKLEGRKSPAKGGGGKSEVDPEERQRERDRRQQIRGRVGEGFREDAEARRQARQAERDRVRLLRAQVDEQYRDDAAARRDARNRLAQQERERRAAERRAAQEEQRQLRESEQLYRFRAREEVRKHGLPRDLAAGEILDAKRGTRFDRSLFNLGVRRDERLAYREDAERTAAARRDATERRTAERTAAKERARLLRAQVDEQYREDAEARKQARTELAQQLREERRQKLAATRAAAAEDRETARLRRLNTKALVQERFNEERALRKTPGRTGGGEVSAYNRALQEIDLQQSLRGTGIGFSGFAGLNLGQQTKAFAQVLQQTLRGLDGAIGQYNLKLARLSESLTPTQALAGQKQVGRASLEVRARQLQLAQVLGVAEQQGLPGATEFRGLLDQFSAARESRIQQQAGLLRYDRAASLANNPELSDERRTRLGEKAVRIKQRLDAQGINNKTVQEAILLEERLARTLLASSNAFSQQANSIIRARSSLSRFTERLKALAYFAGAGAVLFTVTRGITNAFRQTVALESAFTRIQGILPGRTLSERLKIERGTLQAAQDFAANIEDAVKNAQLFAQTGIGVNATIEETRSALAAARGGGITQEQAVETAIAVRSISRSLVASNDIFSRIARIEASTAATGQDLAVSVQRLGALVQAQQPVPLGTVDAFDTLIGSIAEIVQTTRVTGNQAQTAFKFIVSRLAAPDVSRKLQNQFGIKLADETGLGARPVQDILSDIADEFKRLQGTGQSRRAQELIVTVAGARQLGIATALFQNFDRAMEFANESSLAFGDIQRRTALQMDTLEARTTQLGNAFVIFMKSLIEQSGLLAGLKATAKGGAQVVGKAAENPVLAVLATSVVLGVLDLVLSAGAGRLRNVVGKRQLNEAAQGAQRLPADFASGQIVGGVAAGAGISIGSALVTRALGPLSSLLSGLATVVGGWPVLAFIAAVAGFGAVLYKLTHHKDEFEKFKFEFKPPDPKIIEDSLGADLKRLSDTFATSPSQILTGVRTARERTLERLRPQFKNLDDIVAGRATDPRFFKAFTRTFADELGKVIPGLNELQDESERTAAAMRLLKVNIQVGSVQGQENAAEVTNKTNELIEELRGKLLPIAQAIPAPDSRAALLRQYQNTGVQPRKSSGLLGFPIGVYDIQGALGKLPKDITNYTLQSKVAADIGFGYNRGAIDFQRNILKLPLPEFGVSQQINGIMRELFPVFQGTLGNLQAFRDATGKSANALDFLKTEIEDKGLTLGQALDNLATTFLADKKNREAFKEGIKADLARLGINNPLGPQGQGQYDAVGGQIFVNTFLDMVGEAAQELAVMYRRLGQTNEAIQQENLARAALNKENRGKALAATLNAERSGYIRDRLIEILGAFAIREQGIRYTEQRIRPTTGREFDAAQERLRSVEQLSDALGIVGAQTQLDLIRINSRIKQQVPVAIAETIQASFQAAVDAAEQGRASAADIEANATLAKTPLPDSDALKSLRRQQATLQEAIKALSPDALQELLHVAAGDQQGAVDKQFLLESLFGNIQTADDARKFFVTMSLLTQASLKEEKARREVIDRLEKEADVLQATQEFRLARLRQDQALAALERQGRIRQAELGGSLVKFGEENVGSLLRPQSRYRLRGTIASVPLRAEDVVQAARDAVVQAQQALNDTLETIRFKVENRGLGTTQAEDQTREAEKTFKRAVLEASNQATLDLAKLLQEERINILADTQAAIRTATEAGVSGLREVVGNFKSLTEGNLFERLLGPAADSITSGFASVLVDNLFGPKGVFGGAVEDLFGQPARMQQVQQEAELQAQITSNAWLTSLQQGGDYVAAQIRAALGANNDGVLPEQRLGDTPFVETPSYDLPPEKINAVVRKFGELVNSQYTRKVFSIIGGLPKRGLYAVPNFTSDGVPVAGQHRNGAIVLTPAGLDDRDMAEDTIAHEAGHLLTYRRPDVARSFRRFLDTTGIDPNREYGTNFQERFANAFGDAYFHLANYKGRYALQSLNQLKRGQTYQGEEFFYDYLLDQPEFKDHPLQGQQKKNYRDGAPIGMRPADRALLEKLKDEPDFIRTQPGGYDMFGSPLSEFKLADENVGGAGTNSIVAGFQAGADYAYGRIVAAFGQFIPEKPVGPPAIGPGSSGPAIATPEALAAQLPVFYGPGGSEDLPPILRGARVAGGPNNIVYRPGNLTAGMGGVTTPGYYGNQVGTFSSQLGTLFGSAQGKTFGERVKNIKNSALTLAGAYGGAALGGAIGGKGKDSYASEGAALGAGVGNLVAPGIGGLVGGLFGGIIGGLFGKSKPKVTPELAILEKIERGQRAQTAVIENGNRNLLSLDSRLLNAPSSFTLTGYRPANFGGGNSAPVVVQGGSHYTIMVDARGATQPAQVESRVRRAVQQGLRGEGTYVDNRY